MPEKNKEKTDGLFSLNEFVPFIQNKQSIQQAKAQSRRQFQHCYNSWVTNITDASDQIREIGINRRLLKLSVSLFFTLLLLLKHIQLFLPLFFHKSIESVNVALGATVAHVRLEIPNAAKGNCFVAIHGYS